MPLKNENFTIGVEEEYQIIDPQTRHLAPGAKKILASATLSAGSLYPELQRSQVEVATPVCRNLAEVRNDLVRSRRTVMAAAEKNGYRIIATGTHPFSHWEEQERTPKERYQALEEKYQHLAREQLICGYHIHIGLDDHEMSIAILNRARVWLAPLLALSANSPFWVGHDTGYASYRTAIWSRWPMAGPPHYFESWQAYEALVQRLMATGSVKDESRLYWDIRIPNRLPTIEFRGMDVCPTIDEAVMLAGLVRALVRRCYEQAQADEPCPAVRQELLKAAHWRAARFGLSQKLIDVLAGESIPAHTLIERLLAFLRPALEANGDWAEVSRLVLATLQKRNGAERQRVAFAQSGCLGNVVDFLAEEATIGVGEA